MTGYCPRIRGGASENSYFHLKPYWENNFGLGHGTPRKQVVEKKHTREVTVNDQSLLSLMLGQIASAAGITVNPLKIMGIATVYACMRVRAETMASLPCILYKGDGQGGRVPALDHRMYSVLADAPNLEMTSFDFIGALEDAVALRENAYAEIITDSDGDPIGLYPIDPSYMRPERDPNTLRLQYRFSPKNKVYPLKKILHIRGRTKTGLFGLDKTLQLQDVFALAIALQENASKFFGNGSKPGGILEHPAVLSSEAQARILEQFEEKTSGKNAYATMILEEGMKYAATRTDNKDSQFLESREYQDLQICRVFRVPPHKAGITASTPRANVEEENIAFVSDTIRPECYNFEKQFNAKLLTEEERQQGYHFEFDLEELMRGKLKERYESYNIGRNSGFLSANDIRRKEKMNSIGPSGDVYLQPVNYMELGTTLPAAGGGGGKEELGPDGKPKPQKALPAPAKATGIPAEPLPEKVTPALKPKPATLSSVDDTTTLFT